MPVIKSAKKKLRQDRKRQKRNKQLKSLVSGATSKLKKAFSEANLKQTTSLIDKAVKKNLLHKNKAARMKSQHNKLSKNTSKKTKKHN